MTCCCNVLTGVALFMPTPVIPIIPIAPPSDPDSPKPLVPSDRIKDRVCPVVAEAGGDVPEAFRVNVSGKRGVMTLTVSTLDVPDRVRVFVDGVMVFDTGCVGTLAIRRYEDVIDQHANPIRHMLSDTPHSLVGSTVVGKIYVENNREVIVEVLANCVYDMNVTARRDTVWYVSLQCADDSLIDYNAADPFDGIYHIGKAKLSDGSVVETGKQLNWTKP